MLAVVRAVQRPPLGPVWRRVRWENKSGKSGTAYKGITIDANEELLFDLRAVIEVDAVGRTLISFAISLSSTRYQDSLSLGQCFVGFGEAQVGLGGGLVCHHRRERPALFCAVEKLLNVEDFGHDFSRKAGAQPVSQSPSAAICLTEISKASAKFAGSAISSDPLLLIQGQFPCIPA